MKNVNALAASVTLLISAGANAQTDHFVRLDTSALNSMWVGEGLPTADGGSVFQIPQAGGFSLWKCSADGAAQWRNVFPSEVQMTAWDIAATTSGDVLYVSSSFWRSQYMDTLVLAWDLRRIAQDGTVTWHKHVELDTLYSYYFNGLQHIQVVENAGSELFVTFVADFDWQNFTSVHKLSASGDLLWSRRIGDTAAAMSFPSSSSLFAIMPHLVPDQSGGCRLVAPAAQNNDESAYVLRLSSDGDLEWARLFDYLGNVSSFTMYAPTVAADGTALFITSTDSQNGGIHLVRISAEGELQDVQRYDQGGYTGDLKNIQGTLALMDGDRVVTMSETGDLLSGMSMTALPEAADSTYYFQIQRKEAAGGRICFAGTFTATPTGAGLPLASPAITSFDLSTLTCGHTSFTPTGTHSALPNSIYTCGSMPTMAADTVGTTVSEASLTAEPRTLFGSTDLCVYTAVPESSSVAAPFTMNSTLLAIGDPLAITSDQPLRFAFFDARGAVVWNDARSGQRQDIPTAGWAPGLYTVLGRDLAGRPVGTAKVVLER